MSPDAWSETQWADVYLNWIHKPLPSFSVITKKGFTTLFVQKKRILGAPSLCGPQPWASRGANSLSSEAAISLKAAVWLARLPISFSFLLFGKNLQKFLTLTITLLGACLFFFYHALKLVGSQFPDQGLNLGPPAVEGQCPNHWTSREFLITATLIDC